MKAILIVVMLLALGLTTNVKTQPITDEDFCKSYAKSDAQMNRLYKQILVEYRKDTLFIKNFRAAQRAWLAFRDAHFLSRFPEPGNYGSAFSMCRCQELDEMTISRVDQLERWIRNAEEGDVCAGSFKIKE